MLQNGKKTPSKPKATTLKEQLSSSQVEEMLKCDAWKLALRVDDDHVYALRRATLDDAWHENTTGTVTIEPDHLSVDEQALLTEATEQISPTGGRKRTQAAIGAPLTNVGVLAVAGGRFYGLSALTGKEVSWTWALIAAVCCATLSVILSILLANLVRRRTLCLARLDQLEQDAGTSKGVTGVTNTVTLLFVLAIAFAVIAVFIAKPSKVAEHVVFGPISTATKETETTATFTVTWEGVAKDATDVRATVLAPGKPQQSATEPNHKGSASHTFEQVSVQLGSDVKVETQGLDKDGNPFGDSVTHTYPGVR